MSKKPKISAVKDSIYKDKAQVGSKRKCENIITSKTPQIQI